MSLPRLLTALLTAALLAAGGPAAATSTVAGGEDRLAAAGPVVDSAVPLPRVRAESWVLADAETGEVLAARNAHLRLRPASTLKILTALAVLPELDPQATYVAQWEDANTEGSRVGIVPDATYSVHNLLEALFLVSGNDAAWALANAAGGVDVTVQRMNALAKELGALNTHAVNPSGLDAPRQLSTAYDLAVITRAALERDDVRAYATTVKSQFPGKMPKAGKKRSTYEIYTQNKLLLNYRGAIGLKTGWTTKARGTFVGVATRGGRTLIATVMHTDAESWREAGKLLTWGFRNETAAQPVGSLGPAPAPVEPAVDKDTDQQATALAGAALPAGDGGGLPWWLQVPLVLAGVVVVLRVRAVLRQRRRAVRQVQYARAVAARARR